MAKYIIQKAVNADAVKKKLQRSMDYYRRNFEAQPKLDGCCAIIRLDTGECLSRTAEKNYALTGLAAALMDFCLPSNLVLIGEAWWPGKDQFSQISGDFRRHQPSDRLQFVINDILLVDEFDAGVSDVPYVERIDRLSGWALPPRTRLTGRFAPGSYGNPQAMCNALVAAGGHDGLILRDPEGTWTVGSGTTGEIVKIKQVLSFDLTVLEVNEAKGEKTGRPVYKLVVDFNGKRLGVGSGVPHQFEDVPTVGQIVEVEAMDYSSEGLLREPRFKGIRFDKLQADAA